MAAAAAVCLHAAVIRGVIVENFTSKALGRAEVILQPIGGTPGGVKTMRADSHGSFVFDSLAAGAYIVKASRKSHMAAEYGQKRWNSAGLPVILEDDTAAFLNIRLLRYSAISGTVVDENDEGLPGHEVLAYRNSKPPELIAQATRDERGIYRLHGLEPGTYVVRTAGNQSNDGSYLPTFGKETDQLEQARTVDLQPDQEADNVDVRPLPGRLYSLSVVAEKILPGADVAITLASQMGRKTIKASAYRFAALPPGDYELFAQVPADPGPGESIQGGYQRIFLGRDMIVSLLLRSWLCGNGFGCAGQCFGRHPDQAGRPRRRRSGVYAACFERCGDDPSRAVGGDVAAAFRLLCLPLLRAWSIAGIGLWFRASGWMGRGAFAGHCRTLHALRRAKRHPWRREELGRSGFGRARVPGSL
jgi:protocatechuate 3,4-dioxygenase beta subunit